MSRKKGKQKARHWLIERGGGRERERETDRQTENHLTGTCTVFVGKDLFLTDSFIIESMKLGVYSLYSNHV
jgi:hypothetical protein